MLLSGGEVTVAKLFVNNSNGRIGLVGFWDAIAFDEFAGREKKSDKALVDIMKNYMANKSFSRGVETLGAEASMVFVGNTSRNVPYMLKHGNLFDDLPKAYYDSAFIDRIHCYVPGWEFDNIRSEMFSTSYGFVIDYLAEMFRYMRDLDYSSLYRRWFSLSDSISTRDREGINKTFSGLAKLMYPDGEVTKAQAEELLLLAIESRKRVKDQMLRMDSTFAIPEFSCSDTESGNTITVMTAEEKQYAELYDKEAIAIKPEKTPASVSEPVHLVSPDGAMGISYDRLFGKYLEGSGEITVQDPYILTWMQVRNFLEFLNVIARRKKPEDEVTVNLITTKSRSEEEYISQITNLDQLKQEFILQGIKLNYTLDDTGKLHARSITTDTGWKIILDRGLDIFGKFNVRDTLSVTASLQEARKCRAFEMTVIKV